MGKWGEVGGHVTCLRPVESNAGLGNPDRVAEKSPEGMTALTNTFYRMLVMA